MLMRDFNIRTRRKVLYIGTRILKKKIILSYFIFDAIKVDAMNGTQGKPKEKKIYKESLSG